MSEKDYKAEPEVVDESPEELDDEQARALGQRIAEVLHLDCWRGRYATSFGSKTDIGLGRIVANVMKEFETSSHAFGEKEGDP